MPNSERQKETMRAWHAAHKAETQAHYQANKTEILAASKQYYKDHKETINKRRSINNYRLIFPHEEVSKKLQEVGLLAACAYFKAKRLELRKLDAEEKTKTILPAVAAIKNAISILQDQLKGFSQKSR